MYIFYPWWEVWILLFLCENTFSCHVICPIIYSYASIHYSKIPLFKRLKNWNYLTLYSYIVTGKMFYAYPITGKSYIPSREIIIIIHVPSRESIRFVSHLRKMFKFTNHRGKFSYSYPIQEIVIPMQAYIIQKFLYLKDWKIEIIFIIILSQAIYILSIRFFSFTIFCFCFSNAPFKNHFYKLFWKNWGKKIEIIFPFYSIINTVQNRSRSFPRKAHGRWKSDIAKDGYIKENMRNRLSVSKNLNI
jgi:hypothetical protein